MPTEGAATAMINNFVFNYHPYVGVVVPLESSTVRRPLSVTKDSPEQPQTCSPSSTGADEPRQSFVSFRVFFCAFCRRQFKVLRVFRVDIP